MRKTALILLTIFGLGLFLWAQRPMGFNGSRTVVLSQDALVGNQMLPAGMYNVTHLMEGTEHIMIFKQNKKEFRVKCDLEPLTQKAGETRYIYDEEAGPRVLQSIEFRGDTYKHVFAK